MQVSAKSFDHTAFKFIHFLEDFIKHFKINMSIYVRVRFKIKVK